MFFFVGVCVCVCVFLFRVLSATHLFLPRSPPLSLTLARALEQADPKARARRQRWVQGVGCLCSLRLGLE